MTFRKFVVEKKDGDLSFFYEGWHGPKVKGGIVVLGGYAYVFAPDRCRRQEMRPRKFLNLVKVPYQVAYYREGDAEPIPLFSSKKDVQTISGKIIQTELQSKRVKNLLTTELNWYALLALGAIGMAAMLGIMLFIRG